MSHYGHVGLRVTSYDVCQHEGFSVYLPEFSFVLARSMLFANLC